FDLVVEPSRFASSQTSVTGLEAGRELQMLVTLQHGGTVYGSVHTSSGTPVANANVEARLTGQMFGFDDRTVRTATSGSDGKFVLPAAASGALQISARAKGLAAGDPAKLDVTEGASLSGVDLTLSEGKSISGVVTWSDGKPAVNADITVALDLEARMGDFTGN